MNFDILFQNTENVQILDILYGDFEKVEIFLSEQNYKPKMFMQEIENVGDDSVANLNFQPKKLRNSEKGKFGREIV